MTVKAHTPLMHNEQLLVQAARFSEELINGQVLNIVTQPFYKIRMGGESVDRYIGMKQNEMIVNEVLPLIGNSILKTVTELSHDDYQVKLDDTAVDTLLKLSDRISRLIIEYIRLDTEKYIELFKS